jgi:hypothetical protein
VRLILDLRAPGNPGEQAFGAFGVPFRSAQRRSAFYPKTEPALSPAASRLLARLRLMPSPTAATASPAAMARGISTGEPPMTTMPNKPLPKELLRASSASTMPASAELPDEMDRDSGLGVSTDTTDLLIPRLRVIQKTSAVIDQQDHETTTPRAARRSVLAAASFERIARALACWRSRSLRRR